MFTPTASGACQSEQQTNTSMNPPNSAITAWAIAVCPNTSVAIIAKTNSHQRNWSFLTHLQDVANLFALGASKSCFFEPSRKCRVITDADPFQRVTWRSLEKPMAFASSN